MLDRKIEDIARIVGSMTPAAYPDPAAFPAVNGDLADVFEAALNALCGPDDDQPAVVRVTDTTEAIKTLVELCADVPPTEIIWQDTSPGESRDAEPVLPRDHAIGITGAVALIAATGSVVLELPSALAGRASLLVDRHIVIASRDQLLPDLAALYHGLSQRVETGDCPPIQVCITGCSRTADIEKMLVVPAHGPRQVQVILSDEPIDWAVLHRGAASLH